MWNLPKLALVFSTTMLATLDNVLVDSHDPPAASLPQDPPRKPQELDIEQILLAPIGESSPEPHLLVCFCALRVFCTSFLLRLRCSCDRDNWLFMRRFLPASSLIRQPSPVHQVSISSSSKYYQRHSRYNEQKRMKRVLLRSKNEFYACSFRSLPRPQ